MRSFDEGLSPRANLKFISKGLSFPRKRESRPHGRSFKGLDPRFRGDDIP